MTNLANSCQICDFRHQMLSPLSKTLCFAFVLLVLAKFGRFWAQAGPNAHFGIWRPSCEGVFQQNSVLHQIWSLLWKARCFALVLRLLFKFAHILGFHLKLQLLAPGAAAGGTVLADVARAAKNRSKFGRACAGTKNVAFQPYCQLLAQIGDPFCRYCRTFQKTILAQRPISEHVNVHARCEAVRFGNQSLQDAASLYEDSVGFVDCLLDLRIWVLALRSEV